MTLATSSRSQRPELLRRLDPFVVSAGWRLAQLDRTPLGVPIRPEHCFDVLATRSAPFLDRLVQLDRLTFGPQGMPMPEWLFVDGSALPGVIGGLGLDAREIPGPALRRLGIEARPGELVPLAMYIAVPVRPPHVWYGHNLASLNRQLPELELRGLATLTKALGLSVMRCTTQLGATQWASPAMHVHTRFGPLELLTAWTPAHADPATLTYRLRINHSALNSALAQRPTRAPTHDQFWVAPGDHPAIRALETRIERGELLAVVAPPATDGRVPVAPFTPPRAA